MMVGISKPSIQKTQYSVMSGPAVFNVLTSQQIGYVNHQCGNINKVSNLALFKGDVIKYVLLYPDNCRLEYMVNRNKQFPCSYRNVEI